MDETLYPRNCSRWDRCSVNKCPIDPLNPRRQALPGDPERTCKEHPRHRLEIVAQAKADGVVIPGGGLTAEEREMDLTVLLAEWDSRHTRLENFAKAGAGRLKASRTVKNPLV